MKAARVHRFGGPEVVVIDDLPLPQPGRGEIRVRVAAAGVGPWDAWIRSGTSMVKPSLPLILGSDLSGVVEQVGPDVEHLAPGDEVFGVANREFTGAWTEHAVASAATVAMKPAGTAFLEAASVPVIAVTAWQALFEKGKLEAGQRVLIQGAAGNVGALAVQMAHGAGAEVVATCSYRDVHLVRSYGADFVVDRTAEFESAVEEVDLVVDTVGGDLVRRSLEVVKRGGRLVSIAARPPLEEAQERGVEAVFFLVEVTTERLEAIARSLEERHLLPRVGSVLPLADARLAHEMLDGTHPREKGKIMLRCG
jgi:NADPH:quinone reductase-like Zn-dependent oxidoreductase